MRAREAAYLGLGFHREGRASVAHPSPYLVVPVAHQGGGTCDHDLQGEGERWGRGEGERWGREVKETGGGENGTHDHDRRREGEW